jgi:hypothetical protein
MRCEREFLQGMRKREAHTEFACFVRNYTQQPVRLTVPFGQMENRPRLTETEYTEIINRNRARYAASGEAHELPSSEPLEETTGGFTLGKQEVL